MPDGRELFLLKQLQELRDKFRAKYGRIMSQQEQRMLEFAEQLLKSQAAKENAPGE
jgi:hypothetical protein